MAGEIIASLFGAVVGDYVAAKGVAVGGVLSVAVGSAVQRLIRRRMETARDILIEEVRLGEKNLDDAAQVEEMVACMLRYGRAAEEGAARLNLRLMAAMLNGVVGATPMYASDFLQLSSILASLRREEVIVLSICLKWKADGHDEFISVDYLRDSSVSTLFRDEAEIIGVMCSILRTGFVASLPGWDANIYQTTPLFDRLCALVDIEAVLERDARMNEHHTAPKD